MATFGQGINPQLGAIDYSPILRGSLAGAQMAAQGSQMIGQGLANLGEEVGKGIAEYTKKKEERDMYSTGIESKMTRIGASMQRFAEHPEEFGGVSPISKEEYEKLKIDVPKWGGGSIGTLKSGYAEISTLEERVQQAPARALQFIQFRAAQEQERLRPEVENYIAERINGPKTDIMDGSMPFTKVSAAAQVAGEKQMLERKYMQSQINKNDADRPTGTAPTEYVRWTNNWLNDWSAKNNNKTPTAAAIAQADQAWKTSNQPTVPNPVTASIFNDLIAQRLPLQQSINSYSNNAVTQLLDSGQLFTGTAANAKLIGAKLLKAAGFSNFDNEILNTERLAALLVQPTIALAKQLGANPSDYDAKLLSKAQAGDIVYDDATIKALNKARQDIIDSGVNQHNQRLDEIYPANNPDFAQQRAAARLYNNTKSRFTVVEKR